MTPVLDLRRLRVFLAVAEEQHFGAAAQRLFLSQPTVSHHVRTLERDLGVRLLNRDARAVTLTPAGALLARQAGQLLDTGDRLVAQVRATAAATAPPVRVALTTGADGGHLITQAIERLHESRPHVRVLSTYTFGHQLAPLRSGEVDLTLAYLPFAEEELDGIDVTVLREEPRAVYLAAHHRLAGRTSLTVDDIADETFFDRPSVPGFSATWVAYWTLQAERRGRGRDYDLPTTSYEDHAAAIGQGLAISIAPASVIDYYRGRGMVAIPLTDVPPARTALLRLESRRSEDTLALVAAARQIAAEARRPSPGRPRPALDVQDDRSPGADGDVRAAS